MSSRSNRRQGYAGFGALALILVVVAGCNSPGATQPPGAGPLASAAPIVVPKESGANSTIGPAATVPPVTVDQITASYEYRDELITPLAHLYGTQLGDFVVITVQNNNSSPIRIVAMSEVPNYTSQSKDTIDIAAGATEEIDQNPRLTTAAIDGLNSAHQADVHVTVSYLDNGQSRTVLDQTSTTLISSRRDFPWEIDGFDEHAEHQLIAAMVTPSDPSVEELIRKAANYSSQHVMGDITDASDALDQLGAIWQSEDKDYHLTYVSTTETFAAKSQRIRLPGEVLPEASGNCIELSLLYAAVAEALGLNAYIVLIPGHAYFLVDLDGQATNYEVIETTMIGRYAFADAVTEGESEFQTAAEHIKAGDTAYDIVDVAAARAKGITPIEWH